MITGANTNIRHRGIVFHVQTEDSGKAYPHIISHLYHGGTILSSEKTEYAEQVESADLEGIVRGLIEQQHREMVRKLQGGGFDAVIAERLGADALPPAPDEAPTPMPELEPLHATATEESPAKPPPTAVEALQPTPGRESAPASASGGRAFGDGVGSQRPLDEMILDYLSEKARARAAGRASRSDATRKPSSGG